jgi:hypothetical protein
MPNRWASWGAGNVAREQLSLGGDDGRRATDTNLAADRKLGVHRVIGAIALGYALTVLSPS